MSHERWNKYEKAILRELLRAKRPLTTNQVADRVDFAWQTTKKYLDRLWEEEYVGSQSAGRTIEWWIM